MALTPMTKYYIRRLIQGRAAAMGWELPDLDGNNTTTDQAWDTLVNLDTIAKAKETELALLVRLHQSFNQQSAPHQANLSHLESQIFDLLGLSLAPPAAAPPISLTAHPTHSLTMTQALGVLNQVSRVIKKYLGDLITRNYWQMTRPVSNWALDCELSSTAEIIYRGYQDYYLSPEQIHQLQAWLDHCLDHCQRILPQYRKMLTQAQVSWQLIP